VTRHLICAFAFVALATTIAPAAPKANKGIQWRKDIRAALEAAEDRGVPLMLYLTRDD